MAIANINADANAYVIANINPNANVNANANTRLILMLILLLMFMLMLLLNGNANASFFCFLSSGSEGKRWSIPKSTLAKLFLHLNSLIFVLGSFEMCRGNRKRDVTAMVTYSHASTPLGQSERAQW